MTGNEEQDSLLAAMISAVAEGKPAGDLEKGILRLKLISEARDRNLSWNVIARALRYPSGRQLKADTRKLAEHVTRELRLTQNRDAKVTP